MKKHYLIKVLFLFFGISVLLSSCTETGDGGIITPTVTPPTVSFGTGTTFTSTDASINVGTEFTVNLKASKGNSTLKVLTIQEGSTNVSIDRIKINGVAASSNPILLFTTDKTSFEYVITIKSHTDLSPKTYSFTVEDDGAQKTTKNLVITTIATVPPAVKLETGATTNAAPGGIIANKFTVAKGSAQLKTLEVQENGIKMTDLSRVSYDKFSTIITANPYTIPATDKDGFTNREVFITLPTTAGTYVYKFIFTDEAGLSNSSQVTVTVGTTATDIKGVLFNSAGPTGTGGLDLDEAKGTGSSNATAEIRDMGLDANSVWRQQIAGVNGSVVKYVKAGQNGVPTGFTFASVNMKEDIATLFANGVAFTGTTSSKIVVGDVLVVQNGTKYYLLNITKINIVTATNGDNYMIDIKK